MSTIRLNNLSKWFDSVNAIRRLDLEVEEHEFLVVLGPSGCGKTTTLRCIAGVEEPTTGEIFFGDTCIYSDVQGVNVPPKTRNIGFVFQNYALYPHMTVLENVTFGLRIRKLKAKHIQVQAQEAIAFVGLDGFEDRRPSELSGGQQQRVALARVIARQPSILLFDEPLSNLDPKLRTSLRAELKQLHARLGTTSIFVTHDQQEAMILGDRIVVMNNGEIAQVGNPDDIYHYPASVSVARFTGRPITNLIDGIIEQSSADAHVDADAKTTANANREARDNVSTATTFRPTDDYDIHLALPERLNMASGQEMTLHVRPEELDLDLSADLKPFTVYAVQPQGAETLLHLRYAQGRGELLVRTSNTQAVELTYDQRIGVKIHRGNLYSRETGLLVTSFGERPVRVRSNRS
jgi:ABC-type sugar transport system ATPase subunit